MNFIRYHKGVIDTSRDEFRMQLPKSKQPSNEQILAIECRALFEALPKSEEINKTDRNTVALWQDEVLAPQVKITLRLVVNPTIAPGTYKIDLTDAIKHRHPRLSLLEGSIELNLKENVTNIAVSKDEAYPIILKKGTNLVNLKMLGNERDLMATIQETNMEPKEKQCSEQDDDEEEVAFKQMIALQVTNNPELKEALKPRAIEMLNKRRGAFVQQIKNLRRCNVHKVNLQLDTEVPVNLPNYRMSESDMALCRTYIADLL